MNYTNLFPELLKQLPIVRKEDVCYHYQRRQPNNDNKTKLFLPYGKKLLLNIRILQQEVHFRKLKVENH